ncbi:MAG: UDP-N-acetylmuramoyl-tripeptide--D-alanyl-D-alanine ligase [bacterium]|nr:UDP-N-acetylmuramoyl-tripeptide--D-alanyl-D-alanine ligase [bacterium]MDZ4285825.1 UDP-N-acetylmuramoyl-tripeptide--D-alanyl-D-alanine ligase [Candidatus Sungbacteria bacterium]
MLKKSILQNILAFLARATIKKHKPMVIAVTGSAGKTSTRTAIFDMLKSKNYVRTAANNFNNEIGVPLTILGIDYPGRSFTAWGWSLVKAWTELKFSTKKYPEILVLEYAVDRPGDMDYLISIARPDIAVVTAIGEVPAHIEFFKDAEALANEKAKLVRALSVDGYAILNHDDYAVYDMKEKTKAHVMTFGFEENADVRVANYDVRIVKDQILGDVPEGITMKVQNGGSVIPLRLHHAFGKPSCYVAAAAAAVGLVMNKNMVEISESLMAYEPPPGRLRLLQGIKKSFILDDTYNASPEAMRVALDTLQALPGKRKIAVLGDMLEIGRYAEQAHRSIGDRVAQVADMLVTVGARAAFIADEAMTRGAERDGHVLTHEQVMKFDDPAEAGKALDSLIEEGDLILVKGSQAMRMEKAVYEIMGRPQFADKLLVRQEEYWRGIK